MLASADPTDFGKSILTVLSRSAARPTEVSGAVLSFANALAQLGPATLARMIGRPSDPPLPVDANDRRFADAAWSQNAGSFALRQAYLAVAKLGSDVLDAGAEDPITDGKARLAWNFLVDAMAPTCSRTADGPARSTPRPSRWAVTLRRRRARSCTANDLMELIQYAPQTEQVHAIPLLASPPWINKYYVMDLAPQRSFFEWAVQHGRTVFAISYRNPDSSMRDVTMDDYLIHGPQTAMDVVCEITGSPTVDIVGLCLGGALTTMTAAYFAETGDKRIGAITYVHG